MTSELGAERALRQQIQELTAPRSLSEAQMIGIARDLTRYAKKSFDVSAMQDPNAGQAVRQINAIPERAGWVWKATYTNGLFGLSIEGKPMMGIVTMQGLDIEIVESGRSALEKPALALLNDLMANGIKATASIMSDEKAGTLLIREQFTYLSDQGDAGRIERAARRLVSEDCVAVQGSATRCPPPVARAAQAIHQAGVLAERPQ